MITATVSGKAVHPEGKGTAEVCVRGTRITVIEDTSSGTIGFEARPEVLRHLAAALNDAADWHETKLEEESAKLTGLFLVPDDN